MFDAAVSEGVLRVRREGTRWLSTGWNGGPTVADAAFTISVPDGWQETDLDAYVRERCRAAGFDADGPALLTGLDLEHARRARLDPVEVYATAGLSNPAALSMEPDQNRISSLEGKCIDRSEQPDGKGAEPGTVNLVVGTTRSLPAGALANLVAVAAEAKAATLCAETGFTGTTSDAVVVGCDPSGEEATFSGSATEVGAAVRICVRDAVRASLDSRYPQGSFPATVDDAEHGIETTGRAAVSPVSDRGQPTATWAAESTDDSTTDTDP